MNKEQASEFIEKVRIWGEELEPRQKIKLGDKVILLKRGEPIRFK